MTITSRLLLWRTKSDDLIIGSFDNRSEWDSREFELNQAGRLIEIREYNRNDVRVLRKVYERIVSNVGK